MIHQLLARKKTGATHGLQCGTPGVAFRWCQSSVLSAQQGPGAWVLGMQVSVMHNPNCMISL